MIGRLKGVLIEKKPPSLVVDVNGVGYELDAPMTTFYVLPELGHEVTLHTHLIVREDVQQLYGFAVESERALFRQLIKVSGIGAKMAISVLSGISADGFIRCVQDNDALSLTRLPGIGKKTAERLIVEMRDRIDDKWKGTPQPVEVGDTFPVAKSDAVADAVSALISLGYKPQEASRWVRNVEPRDLPSEEIIRQALQMAAK